MSDIITKAVEALSARIDHFDGSAKFVIRDIGAIMVNQNGVYAGDEAADVTLTADLEVFRALIEGNLKPMSAFMSGKLVLDGPMGVAMKLGSAMAS